MNKFTNFLQRAHSPTLGALLFFLTLSSEPAHGFGKKPVVIPNQPSTPNSSPVSKDVIRARWETNSVRDGAAWSQHIYESLPSLAPNLLNRDPTDIAQFCPAYADLNATDKKNFWVYLLSSITELESDFNPAMVYTEKFLDAKGNQVRSIGLLQLSLGDAAIYGCDFRSEADIEDPARNLDCGLRILNKLVGKDKQLAGRTLVNWLGGARYWSTLRSTKASTIQGWTSAMRICAQ